MRRLLLAAVLFVTVSHPARAQFCPGASPWVFDDVPANDLFCGYITWAAQNGITLGCAIIDANHRLYCPNDGVTRSQMAAFVNRLGNVRVEAVGTGPGLTGGPITSVGTINLATTQLLPTTACTNNQIARWNGSAWVCSTDANSGGTVTSVASGTGLTGGPITSSGTLSLAPAYQLPQSCTNGQVAKSNGTGGWTCASDAIGTGTVTSITAGAGLTGGTITTSGTIALDPASTTLTGNFFKQGGNAFGTTAVVGTNDNNALDVQVNGARAMRYEPNTVSPNVIGGSSANVVTAGVWGATIAGGGVPTGDTDPVFLFEAPNRVTDAYGTVGGGYLNRAGNDAGSVTDAAFASVGGGWANTASAFYATVGGGGANTASGGDSVVGGGANNTASGFASAVPGGWSNKAAGDYSFAAGRRARANGTGSFAWADGNDFDFVADTAHEFVARATGGARFVTAIDGTGLPTTTFRLASDGRASIPTTVALEAMDAPLITRGWDPFNATAPVVKQNLGRWGLFMEPNRLVAGVPSVTGREFEVARYNLDGTRVTLLRVDQAGNLFTTGSINPPSDAAAKTGFAPVAADEMLERVVALPISSWSYRASPNVRHVGPMAQDFRAAFGVGENDTTIATVDADGVALAAIQGLNAKLEAKVAEQAREIAELKRAVEVLLARTSPEGRVASR